MLKEVKIEVTNQCYRNCKHCSSEATCDKKSILSLDKETVMRVIREARELGAGSVAFSGGEATLYPSISEVVKYAKDLGMKTKMYTMCYRTNSSLAILKQLNIDGLDEIIYSTAFPLVISKDESTYSLEEFIALLVKDTNLSIGFHHVITNETLDCLNGTIKYLESTSNRLTKMAYLRYVPHGRGDDSLCLTREQNNQFKEFILTMKDKYDNKIKIGSPFNILGVTNTKCNAADETIIVGYDRLYYPCDACKYYRYLGAGGNIDKDSLSAVYNSPYFKAIREVKDCHNEACQACKNYDVCKSGCLGQKMVYITSIGKMESMEEYEANAKRTENSFPNRKLMYANAWMGPFGETGELVDCFKKLLTHISTEDNQKAYLYGAPLVIDEIGDIIWYMAATISSYYGIPFSEIGKYILKDETAETKLVDDNIIKYCSLLKDPECMCERPVRDQFITKVDHLLNEDTNDISLIDLVRKLADDFIKLYGTLKEDDFSKDEIIAAEAGLYYDLGLLAYKYLNTTLAEIHAINILRLQSRYAMGFDSEVAKKRIEIEAQHKTGNSYVKQ